MSRSTQPCVQNHGMAYPVVSSYSKQVVRLRCRQVSMQAVQVSAEEQHRITAADLQRWDTFLPVFLLAAGIKAKGLQRHNPRMKQVAAHLHPVVVAAMRATAAAVVVRMAE